MASIKKLKENCDIRGSLVAIEDFQLDFKVQRIFYIYDVKGKRGGHGHKVNKMGLVALNGALKVEVQSPKEDTQFVLDNPKTMLLLDPEDWHELVDFLPGTVLLVICSEHWSKDDYFFEPYRAKA